MKKWICLILAALLVWSLSLTAFATIDPVADEALLLTAEEDAQLTEYIASFSQGDVQILTIQTLDGWDVETYAKNHAHTYGIGVLMVIAMEERQWCITSAPAFEDAIDGEIIDWISAECVPYLQADDYYGAFMVFAENCAYYLDGYTAADTESDEQIEYADESGGGFGRFVVCLLIGLAAGGITAGVMAGKNKSVRPRNSAANYVRSNSMVVSVSRDIFLYHNVTRTLKPQNNSSSGGSSSGGSRSTRSGSF